MKKNTTKSRFHALAWPVVVLGLERRLVGCTERKVLGRTGEREAIHPILWLESRSRETQGKHGATSKPTSTLLALEQLKGPSWTLSMTQRKPHSEGSLDTNSALLAET